MWITVHLMPLAPQSPCTVYKTHIDLVGQPLQVFNRARVDECGHSTGKIQALCSTFISVSS